MSKRIRAVAVFAAGWFGVVGIGVGGCTADERGGLMSGDTNDRSTKGSSHDDGGTKDSSHDDGGMNTPPVRLLAPLSGSINGSLRPLFRWSGYEGTVEVCRDRRCLAVIASFGGQTGEARPDAPLPAGMLFWRVHAGGQSTATWEIVIPHRESGRPIAFASVPDYNGDGLADVTFGTPTATAGTVSIFYGLRGYAEAPGVPSLTPDVTLDGGAGFGCGVAAIGDTNGDGFTDLGVASGCTGSGTGAVTIYMGSPTGLVPGPELSPGMATASFGTSLASAGDTNGDGYGDVVVGGALAAQLFLGGPTGLATTHVLVFSDNTGEPPTRVQGPGDINGDGVSDILVTHDVPGGSGVEFGAVLLGIGGGGGFFLQELPFIGGNGFGFAGDANGDGYEDLNYFGLMPGAPIQLGSSPFLDIGPSMPFYAAAGDINGDGFGDQIRLMGEVTASPEHYRITFGENNSCRQGQCLPFVYFGTPGLTPTEFAIIAGIGDTNGDGFDDLVASRPSIGEAYLYLGGPGFPGSPARTWTGPVGFAASVPALYGTATFYGVP